MRPLLLWLALTAGAVAQAAPWSGLPDDADARWGEVSQVRVPAWRGRALAAAARVSAAAAYARGDVALSEAFVGLAGANLDDPLVVAGRRARLDERALARASDRAEPAPDLGTASHLRVARTALRRALAAEDAADEAERRLLIAVGAHLTRHPELTTVGLAPLRKAIADAVSQATSPLPDDPSALAHVGDLDAEAARLETWVRQARHRATAPGAATLSVAADTAALSLAPDMTGSALRADARLAVFGPLSDDPDAAQGARLAWRVAVVLPALKRERDALSKTRVPEIWRESDPQVLHAALAALEARPALPEPTGRTDALGRALDESLTLRSTVRELRRDQLVARIAERDAAVAGVTGAVARAEREQARRDAEESESREAAEVLRAVAQTGARAAHADDARRNVAEWTARASAGRRAELVAVGDAIAAIEQAGASLLGGRDDTGMADDAYVRVRSAIRVARQTALRLEDLQAVASAAVSRDRAALEADRAAIDALGVSDGGAQAAAVARWRAVLSAEEDALAAAEAPLHAALDVALGDLRALKDAKRSLRPDVSAAQRQRDWDVFPLDLRWELRLLVPSSAAVVRDQLALLATVPGHLLNPGFLGAAVRRSLGILVLLVAWTAAARGADRAVVSAITRANADARVTRRLLPLRAPLTDLLRAGLALAALWALWGPVTQMNGALGFGVWVALQLTVVRLAMAAFSLVVVPFNAGRPALWVLGGPAHRLAWRTCGLLVAWLVGRGALRHLIQDGLGADALMWVTRSAVDVLVLLALGVLLHRWGPVLRDRVRHFHQQNRWVAALSRTPPSALLTAPIAAVTAAYLFAASTWDGVQRMARISPWFGSVLASVTRMTLQASEELEPVASLPDDLVEALKWDNLVGEISPPSDADARLVRAAVAWTKNPQRGIVALTGDLGEGRGRFLARVLPQLAADRPVRRLRVAERLTTEADALMWLSKALDIGCPATAEAAVDALRALPPSVIAVEGVERAFLRAVGGFSALRSLLYILNATSGRHFTVITSHRYAWSYLRRLGPLVPYEVVRETVDLTPMSLTPLRELCMERLGAARYRASFDDLVSQSPFGVAPEVELERATGAFFQLLADASEGNPGVALGLFLQCLRPAGSRHVRVALHECLGSGTLDGLTEEELFTLVALRTQGRLGEDELVRVTNMSAGAVRSVVRDMMNRGMLVSVGRHVGISMRYLPITTRTLRRRHLLHFEG